MKHTLKICSLWVFSLLLFVSCKKKFLDKPIDDVVSLQESFKDIRQARNWVNNIYIGRINEYNLLGNAGFSCGSDEAIHGDITSTNTIFYNGSWNSQNSPTNIWASSWQNIRKCNVFFENIQYTQVIKNDDTIRLIDDNFANAYFVLQRLKGEAFFLRAFYYAEMLKYYGEVPIVKKSFAPTENFSLPKNTVEEVVSFIKQDLDSAMSYLPDSYPSFDNWVGRATKPIAMAYKARVLLLYASPLHNPANDVNRWKAAADLLGTFISNYSPTLFDLETQVQKAFFDPNSKETVFNIRETGGNNTIDKVQRPAGFKFFTGPAVNPSQKLVDAFQMKNGKSIADPSYDPANPYRNRDPRFYQFINFNTATLPDNPSGSIWTVRQIETFTGGKDASAIVGGTRTGYYMRKFMDTTLNLVNNQSSFRPYVLMRFPEILLSYAESVNEAYGPYASASTSTLTAAAAIEKIRQRAGLVPFALSVGLSKDEMRDALVQERRIELAFEGFRFWDARRWKKAELWFNTPAKGVTVTRTAPNIYTYQYADVENKTFSAKMYLFPIPEIEIRYNPNIRQNTGW
jgi:hypothetical protein